MFVNLECKVLDEYLKRVFGATFPPRLHPDRLLKIKTDVSVDDDGVCGRSTP